VHLNSRLRLVKAEENAIGQNNGHDRPTGNHTPVAGKVQQPAVDSQDIRYPEIVILGGNTSLIRSIPAAK